MKLLTIKKLQNDAFTGIAQSILDRKAQLIHQSHKSMDMPVERLTGMDALELELLLEEMISSPGQKLSDEMYLN